MILFISRFTNAFVLIAMLALSAAASAASGPIVIGHVIDLSGPHSGMGRDYAAGVKTYIDAVNAQGGLQGRKLHYLSRDDQGIPALAAKQATDLIERDQVDLLLGGVGDETTQAILDAPAFRKSNHVLYAPLAGAGIRPDSRVLIWRPSYQQELDHIFGHFRQLGIKSIAIAYQETAANQAAYKTLQERARQAGMRLTGTIHLGRANARLSSDAATLAAGQPEFVMVIADTINTALFLKEFRKVSSHTFVASTSLVDLTTLKELVGAKALEWTIFSQVVPDPNAASTTIQVEHMMMMKKFRDEALSSLTLEGFAAGKTLVKILQQSKRPARLAFQDYVAQPVEIDLGGLAVHHGKADNPYLSRYVELALFRKNGRLKF